MSKIDNENNSKIEKSQGFLLIDKPAGMTSHDVVDAVRDILQPQTSNSQLPKVGHTGTLDPFATGLLIVGVSRVATREMQKLVGLDKEYEATFVLGASSTTDDTEGEKKEEPVKWNPDVIQRFIGEIEQVPPTYSAIKIGGKKMYEAAREGKPIEGKPRRVMVYAFDISPIRPMEPIEPISKIHAHIRCSSGTYIRALARDLGRALGGGGYVEQLRRTSIGPFAVADAQTLDALEALDALPLFPVPQFLAKL